MKSELKSAGMVRTIAALQEERDALQVENERLKETIREQGEQVQHLADNLKTARDENERLKAEISGGKFEVPSGNQITTCNVRRFGRVRMPARLRTIHILKRKDNRQCKL